MSEKPPFKLDLLYENTFKKHYPDLNQAELEAKFLEEFKTYKKSKKLSHVLAWKEFQKKRGTLLAPDPKGVWGEGKPLFRASIKSNGKLSVDIAPQVRAWRTKFLTEGSPGTKLALKDTGKQFYDSKTGYALQIHHEKGISEYGPFIDESIKKLIPGNSSKVLKEGLQEYNAFKKWAFDTGRVFGDKAENYTALAKNQHINIPGSVHELRGPRGPFYSVRSSGASAFDDKVKTLKAQTGLDNVSLTPTKDLLNKAYRKGYTKNYDITKPGTIWDEMGAWSDLTEPSTKDATALSRQIGNPEDRPYIKAKIDEARIKSTDIKNQIPVIKKLAAEYEVNEGLDKIDAINKAKIEYNRIKYGDTFAKGLDIRKLGLIAGGMAGGTTALSIINQAAGFAKAMRPDAVDLLNPKHAENIAQGEARIKAGENPWTVIKEEGKESLGVLAEDLKMNAAMVAAMKILSGNAAIRKGAGALFPPAVPALVGSAAYQFGDAYLEEKTGKGLTTRIGENIDKRRPFSDEKIEKSGLIPKHVEANTKDGVAEINPYDPYEGISSL